jgi:hypothetical protein
MRHKVMHRGGFLACGASRRSSSTGRPGGLGGANLQAHFFDDLPQEKDHREDNRFPSGTVARHSERRRTHASSSIEAVTSCSSRSADTPASSAPVFRMTPERHSPTQGVR